MAGSLAGYGSGEGPQYLACLQVTGYEIVAGRGAPIPTPRHITTLETGFQKTHIYPYTKGGPGRHSSKAPSPKEPQALGCPDQGNQPGKYGTKVGGGGV